jgi:hypothetical protein
MVSYWVNQLKGFGKHNDDQLYVDICKKDINGRLFEEAKVGFGYATLCIELRALKKMGYKK